MSESAVMDTCDSRVSDSEVVLVEQEDSKISHQSPTSSAKSIVHNKSTSNLKQESCDISCESNVAVATAEHDSAAQEVWPSVNDVELGSNPCATLVNDWAEDSNEPDDTPPNTPESGTAEDSGEPEITPSAMPQIEEVEDNSEIEQDDPQTQSTEAELVESNGPKEDPRPSLTTTPMETLTATKPETGAAFLRQICDGTRSVENDTEAARFLRTIHKSANRVRLLDKLRESVLATECLKATWTYTQKSAVFEKRAIKFINILRMQSSRLDIRKEHLTFWISHLGDNGVPDYFTYLALNSNLSNRAASSYGWLLTELSKLDKCPDARFYQQCCQEPKIAIMLQNLSKDANPKQMAEKVASSNLSYSVADFRDPPLSKTEVEWRKRKLCDTDGQHSIRLIAVMDELMTLTGLEPVKRFFMDTIDQYDMITKYDVKKKQIFNTTFTGNPGVGKTTVAKLYARLLLCLMKLPEDYYLVVENGLNLAFEEHSRVANRTGLVNKGVIMIDEATHLGQKSEKRVLILLNNMEKRRGIVPYVLTGLTSNMASFQGANPRFQSLLPHNINIDDHTTCETFALLKEEIKIMWDGKMQVEGGESGLNVRIAARRLSKGRGCKGFANFHAIERFVVNAGRRNARRMATAKAGGDTVLDEMLLTRDDLLGPPPDEGIRECKAWKTLHEMIGLEKVKKAVESLAERVGLNYQRELCELPTLDINLNRLFLGNPGTGKTTVAKLYAEIMAKSGVLSSSEVILKTPTDFTSEYIGGTATRTKDLLESARGKVLVIDEAYMMYPDKDRSVHNIHSAAIDAIVSDVQGVAGEDRAVLLLGYRDKMENMLQKGNPGLERRFPLSMAFVFEDYTRLELLEIFQKKMKKQGLSCTSKAADVAMDLLDKARRRPNFGNAGEVDNVLSKAKQQASLRFHGVPLPDRPVDLVLQPEDFDPEYQRSETATVGIASLFQNVLECEHLITKLQGYANACENLRVMGIQPSELIPFSFVFKGPPGTFKTSAARAFGQAFYDMGLLTDNSVVDCSVTDLVGEYCGQTGVKTQRVLDKAIGKVLLIDEAYRLFEISKFGEEAVGELIDAMTKPRYMQKMVIILAGDAEKMNQFMLTHHHLRSRFAEDIVFKPLGVEQSYELLIRSVSLGNRLPIELGTDVPYWEQRSKTWLDELVNLPTWGNGRDVTQILAKRVISRVISKPLKVTNGQKTRLVCGGQDFHDELERLCIERRTLMAR